MRAVTALLAVVAGAGVYALARRASAGGPKGGVLAPSKGLLEIWSLSSSPGQLCGLPLCPTATGNFGATVHDIVLPPGTRGWGWTPPGDLRAAERFGLQLVADIEDRKSTKAKPSAGWTGAEVAEAEQLADRVGALTSHGFVFKNLRPILAPFAARGRWVYPQVYDSDRSTQPRKFLRQCVTMWQDAGFETVVPLLGASAGADWLQEWLEECDVLGLASAIYSAQRMKQLGIACPVAVA